MIERFWRNGPFQLIAVSSPAPRADMTKHRAARRVIERRFNCYALGHYKVPIADES